MKYTRKVKNFYPDSNWDVVFEDGTIRPLVGWVVLHFHDENGQVTDNQEESIVGAFFSFDQTPYIENLLQYLEESYRYGDIARYQRHSSTLGLANSHHHLYGGNINKNSGGG